VLDRQRPFKVVDLDHRAERIVPVLLLASSNGKNMVELQAHFGLPEFHHGIQTVRTKAKVDSVLAQLHRDASSVSSLEPPEERIFSFRRRTKETILRKDKNLDWRGSNSRVL
jgi:hypothetical protein